MTHEYETIALLDTRNLHFSFEGFFEWVYRQMCHVCRTVKFVLRVGF